MEELSIFVDESGDFGAYESHAPYYLVTFVFHEQSNNIADDVKRFNDSLFDLGICNRSIHAGPLIRREEDYENESLETRRQIFNRSFNFTRKVEIMYHTFLVEKRQLSGNLDLYLSLSKQISGFLSAHLTYFMKFDKIILYYDNGQMELTKLLASVFASQVSNVEFRKVLPANYKLFQSADLICTLELIAQKEARHLLSNSEIKFFRNGSVLKKNYLKPLRQKRLD